MQQKICLISFDHWNYDSHIITDLKSKGIESFHIKIGNFKHANLLARVMNAFQKIFLGKNPKIKKRQDFIIQQLEKKGLQDQILVINPELIEKEYHLEIKKYTKKYIAYLYDSVERCNITHLLDSVFDEVYSFDKDDIKKYNFKETSNYNYIQKSNNQSKNEYDVLYVGSIDNRIEKLNEIGDFFNKENIKYKFYIIGKKSFVYNLKKIFKKKYQNLNFQRNRINQEDLITLYSKSATIIDLVRDNQSGLSFRFFEAMALEKKIITNNKSVMHYNFYSNKNIYVMENLETEIDIDFIKTAYDKLPEAVYNEYTLSSWTNKIFNLESC
jgi:hypothetical protein